MPRRLRAMAGTSSILERKVLRSILRKVQSSSVVTLAERPRLSETLISPDHLPGAEHREDNLGSVRKARVDLDGAPEKHVDGLAGLLGGKDARPREDGFLMHPGGEPLEIPRRHPRKRDISERTEGSVEGGVTLG